MCARAFACTCARVRVTQTLAKGGAGRDSAKCEAHLSRQRADVCTLGWRLRRRWRWSAVWTWRSVEPGGGTAPAAITVDSTLNHPARGQVDLLLDRRVDMDAATTQCLRLPTTTRCFAATALPIASLSAHGPQCKLYCRAYCALVICNLVDRPLPCTALPGVRLLLRVYSLTGVSCGWFRRYRAFPSRFSVTEKLLSKSIDQNPNSTARPPKIRPQTCIASSTAAASVHRASLRTCSCSGCPA